MYLPCADMLRAKEKKSVKYIFIRIKALTQRSVNGMGLFRVQA